MLILKEIIPKNFYIKVNGAPDLLKGTLRSHSTSFRSPSYNKGYTVQPSARASPKFFFRYATEKLRISLTFPASINRPNLKFHFLPTRDRRKKPASYGQIAENKVFREKLLLPDRRENQQNASHFV